MRMCFRLAFLALLLAGREPWLAFLSVRCGLAIGKLQNRGNGNAVTDATRMRSCTTPPETVPSCLMRVEPQGSGLPRRGGRGAARGLERRAFSGQRLPQAGAKDFHETRRQESEQPTHNGR